MSSFKKASDIQSYARIALFGPSGSGKTVSALRMAKGLGGSIAIIDTEYGSSVKAKKNEHVNIEFDVAELTDRSIGGYTAKMHEAASERYNVLIIDSLSHAWRELLQFVDKITENSKNKSSFAAWAKGDVQQNELIQAILAYPGHIIATMRVNTEWDWQVNPNTQKREPVRIGQKPEQGRGIEYEFDMLAMVYADHTAQIIKDRTGKYQDQVITLIDESIGRDIKDWLASGAIVPMATEGQQEEFLELAVKLKASDKQIETTLKSRGVTSFLDLRHDRATDILLSMREKLAQKERDTQAQAQEI